MDKKVYFKDYLQNLCKLDDISPRRIRVQQSVDLIIIHIKNNQKNGVELESFKIMNNVIKTLAPLGIKFNTQLYYMPGKKILDRIDIQISLTEYEKLNNILNQ